MESCTVSNVGTGRSTTIPIFARDDETELQSYPINADATASAAMAVRLCTMAYNLELSDPNHVWQLYEVFDYPPIERRLAADEAIVFVRASWPVDLQQGCRFELRQEPPLPALADSIKGKLDKRGGSHKSWKSRFFMLSRSQVLLTYYKSQPSKLKQLDTPVGSWSCRNVYVYSIRQMKKAPRPEYCFCLKPATEPLWPNSKKEVQSVFENTCKFMCARSSAERTEWIVSIVRAATEDGQSIYGTSSNTKLVFEDPNSGPSESVVDSNDYDEEDDSTYASIPSQARQPAAPLADDIYGDPDQGVVLSSSGQIYGETPPSGQLYGDLPPQAVTPPTVKPVRSISLPPEPTSSITDPGAFRRAASTRPLPAVPATAAGNSKDYDSDDTDEDIDLYGSIAPSSHLYGAVEEEQDEDDTHIPTLSRDRSTFRRPTFVRQEPSPLDLGNDPRNWSNSDVLRWLKEYDFDDFKEKIYANGFVGTQLLGLRATDFRAHGFSSRRCSDLAAALADLNERVRLIKRQSSDARSLAGQLVGSLTPVAEGGSDDELYGQPNNRAVSDTYPDPSPMPSSPTAPSVSIDPQEEYTALPPARSTIQQLSDESEEYAVLPPSSQSSVVLPPDEEYTALPPIVPAKPKTKPKLKAKPTKPPKLRAAVPTPPPKPPKPSTLGSASKTDLIVRPGRSVTAMAPPTYTSQPEVRLRPASVGVSLGLYEVPEAAKLKARQRDLKDHPGQDDVYDVPSGLPIANCQHSNLLLADASQQCLQTYGETLTQSTVSDNDKDKPKPQAMISDQLYGDAPGLGGLVSDCVVNMGVLPTPVASNSSAVYDDRAPEYGPGYDDMQPTYQPSPADYGQPLLEPNRQAASLDSRGYSTVGSASPPTDAPPLFADHEYAYPTVPTQADSTYAEVRETSSPTRDPPAIPQRPAAKQRSPPRDAESAQQVYGEGEGAIFVPVHDDISPANYGDSQNMPMLEAYATVAPASVRNSLMMDDEQNVYEIEEFVPQASPILTTRPAVPARPSMEALYGASFVTLDSHPDPKESLPTHEDDLQETSYLDNNADPEDKQRSGSALPVAEAVAVLKCQEEGTRAAEDDSLLQHDASWHSKSASVNSQPLLAAAAMSIEASQSPSSSQVPILADESYENLKQQSSVTFDDSADDDAAVVYLEDMAGYVNVDAICQHYGSTF
eukprot:m.116389 g.116389  ORF g.116389 m.116389 type:complete len:1180 (+) comp15516_c0_seq1:242-3781(+)